MQQGRVRGEEWPLTWRGHFGAEGKVLGQKSKQKRQTILSTTLTPKGNKGQELKEV